MRLGSTSLLACLALAVGSVRGFPMERRRVSQGRYDDLTWYFQYASSAYSDYCGKPNGGALIKMINNMTTDTQGFVARDDIRMEVVVSFRGSTSVKDNATDYNALLVPFNSPGVSPPSGTLVHRGFLGAWNSVAPEIISLVKNQLSSYPEYTIVTTGHSLGGSLASLAGISLRQNFPLVPMRMYTYGQVRTGNLAYAEFVNENFWDRVFRVTHTNDGVPTMVPTSYGYHHHGVEYWLNPDPPSAEHTTRCDPSGEDPKCSASIPTEGMNAAHFIYMNITSHTPFCS